MTKKTEQAVIKAALRWFKISGGFLFDSVHRINHIDHAVHFENACASHEKAMKGKRK